MKIGYARVSTAAQNLDMQVSALTDAGCEKIYTEKVSGVGDRTELKAVLEYLRDGDSLVIYKLDRLGRNMKDLLAIIEQLQKRNISLVSLRDNIDTGSTTGKLVLHIFASLAEFERDLIKERTDEGRREAKKKGVRFGRPKQPKPERASMCAQLYRNGNSVSAIMRTTGIRSRNTVYKYLRMEGIEINNN
jgi:DNA invertase Pin-like site-specific DNA recombinase|nr:recombinase family protein [uncultured Prevotella sp.]